MSHQKRQVGRLYRVARVPSPKERLIHRRNELRSATRFVTAGDASRLDRPEIQRHIGGPELSVPQSGIREGLGSVKIDISVPLTGSLYYCRFSCLQRAQF